MPVGLSFYCLEGCDGYFLDIISDMYVSNDVELIIKGEPEVDGTRIDQLPKQEVIDYFTHIQNNFIQKLETRGHSNVQVPTTYNQQQGRFTETIRDAAHDVGMNIYFEQYVSELGYVDPLPDFDVLQYSVGITTVDGASGPNTTFKEPSVMIQDILDFQHPEIVTINGIKVVPMLSHQQDFRTDYGSDTLDTEKWETYKQMLIMARDHPQIEVIQAHEIYDMTEPPQ